MSNPLASSAAVLAAVLVAMLSVFSSLVAAKHKVVVSNDVQSMVKVHCQSADNDLGVHYLAYDRSVEWKFNDNIWGTTLFYCDFTWGKVKAHAVVYAAEKKRYGCHEEECYWMISTWGIFMLNSQTVLFERMYRWQGA